MLIGAAVITTTDPGHRAALTFILVCLGHAVGMTVAAVLHLSFLRRAVGPDALQGVTRSLPVTVLTSLAAAAAGYGSAQLMLAATGSWPPAGGAVVSGLIAGLAAVAVMAGLTFVLNRRLLISLRQLSGR